MQEQGHNGTRKSIAIVGTGMAGLISAYLLNKDPERRFDVELFEAVRFQTLFCRWYRVLVLVLC